MKGESSRPAHYRRNRTDSKFKQACDAIKSGDLSVRQAANKFGFSKSTLHDAVTKKHVKKAGGQTILKPEEESNIVQRLVTLSKWGFPLDSFELRVLVKNYLDRRGVTIRKLKNNLPGPDWARSFMKRNRNELSQRMCQNIKVARAKVTPTLIRSYFGNLEKTLENVQPQNIINYDETNLSDDPGRKKVIVRRGTKYPERVMNSTKSK